MMQAYADYQFPGTFFLNEERIRKISNIIRRRISPSMPQATIEYVVYRSDNFVFETYDTDDVISQENTPDSSITTLTLKTDQASLRFTLTFSRTDGVSVNIRGADRDFVFLLYSDIKEYVSQNVIVPRRFTLSKETYEIIGYIVVFLSLAYMIIPIVHEFTSAYVTIDELKKTDDLNAKLNFLIEGRKVWKHFDYKVFLPIILLGMLFSYIPSHILSRFNIANVFYFGGQIKRYDKYTNTRNRLMWGVLVAFVVSFLAGIITWLITR